VNIRFGLATLVAAVLVAGCSFENKYEREADKITKAVMANDLTPVKDDLSPDLHITRVQIAAASDELNDQGKLESIKEVTPCSAGAGVHCFTVTFEKSTYHETLAMDDQNKVTLWRFHIADAR
jgi:outer membrane murein-binding lipoprotein Lpp